MSGVNAMHARRVCGVVYIRQEDVLRYLHDLADDWERDSLGAGATTPVGDVAIRCVRRIAEQLGRITA